jgi:hypothetical protein
MFHAGIQFLQEERPSDPEMYSVYMDLIRDQLQYFPDEARAYHESFFTWLIHNEEYDWIPFARNLTGLGETAWQYLRRFYVKNEEPVLNHIKRLHVKKWDHSEDFFLKVFRHETWTSLEELVLGRLYDFPVQVWTQQMPNLRKLVVYETRYGSTHYKAKGVFDSPIEELCLYSKGGKGHFAGSFIAECNSDRTIRHPSLTTIRTNARLTIPKYRSVVEAQPRLTHVRDDGIYYAGYHPGGFSRLVGWDLEPSFCKTIFPNLQRLHIEFEDAFMMGKRILPFHEDNIEFFASKIMGERHPFQGASDKPRTVSFEFTEYHNSVLSWHQKQKLIAAFRQQCDPSVNIQIL